MVDHKAALQQLFAEVGRETHLQQESVEGIYLMLWEAVLESFLDSNHPRVIIPEFGTFVPYLPNIAKELKRIEKRKISGESKENDPDKEKELYALVERLSKESNTRKQKTDYPGKKRKVPSTNSNSEHIQRLQSDLGYIFEFLDRRDEENQRREQEGIE